MFLLFKGKKQFSVVFCGDVYVCQRFKWKQIIYGLVLAWQRQLTG